MIARRAGRAERGCCPSRLRKDAEGNALRTTAWLGQAEAQRILLAVFNDLEPSTSTPSHLPGGRTRAGLSSAAVLEPRRGLHPAPRGWRQEGLRLPAIVPGWSRLQNDADKPMVFPCTV